MMKFLATIFLLFSFTTAHAANIEIEMLNKLGKEKMLYSKKLVKIAVGDTVNWKATDKTHNVAFIKGGVPEGVKLYKSKMNKDAEYTFTVPGVYAYKCTPHYGMGMIGFVVVGNDTSNLEQVKAIKYPGKAKKVASETLATL